MVQLINLNKVMVPNSFIAKENAHKESAKLDAMEWTLTVWVTTV